MADDYRQGFACAPGLRIEAHERLSDVKFAQVQVQLTRIEMMVERLEKRLWLAVYGVVAVVLGQGVLSILQVGP
jgi:hypothetical protein